MRDWSKDGLRRLPVVLADSLVEFLCHAANSPNAVAGADISPTQAARGHTAQVLPGLKEQHRFAHARRLYSGNNTAGSAAVHANLHLHN